MLFSSGIFLFAFLPIVIIGNYLIRFKFRNYFLLISSLIFFAWGGVSFSLILLISILLNYIVGLLINCSEGRVKKTVLAIGVIINLFILGLFKYAGFVISNLNFFAAKFNLPDIPDPGIVLPIGISFYTFQAMSYIIDVYRKEVNVQKNLFNLALYISFFPQLIAGPIVRYNLIEHQIKNRRNNSMNLVKGIQRFVLGLVKKIVIADQFGLIADKIFGLNIDTVGSSTAWIGVVCYTMQVYFDFSGYSDMAIGLGRMFGFKFPENFNFPYMARSIREFWQRWHITLSIWLRITYIFH